MCSSQDRAHRVETNAVLNEDNDSQKWFLRPTVYSSISHSPRLSLPKYLEYRSLIETDALTLQKNIREVIASDVVKGFSYISLLTDTG